MDIFTAWTTARQLLQVNVGAWVFDTYFGGLELLGLDADVWYFSVPNMYSATLLSDPRPQKDIRRALASVLDVDEAAMELRFEVKAVAA